MRSLRSPAHRPGTTIGRARSLPTPDCTQQAAMVVGVAADAPLGGEEHRESGRAPDRCRADHRGDPPLSRVVHSYHQNRWEAIVVPLEASARPVGIVGRELLAVIA